MAVNRNTRPLGPRMVPPHSLHPREKWGVNTVAEPWVIQERRNCAVCLQSTDIDK